MAPKLEVWVCPGTSFPVPCLHATDSAAAHHVPAPCCCGPAGLPGVGFGSMAKQPSAPAVPEGCVDLLVTLNILCC